MKISLEITGPQERQIAETARRLNIAPEVLAAALLRDLFANTKVGFDELANRVVEKSDELHRRLRE